MRRWRAAASVRTCHADASGYPGPKKDGETRTRCRSPNRDAHDLSSEDREWGAPEGVGGGGNMDGGTAILIR